MARIKSFKLGGHDIKVKYVKVLRKEDGEELFGRADPRSNLIEVGLTLGGAKLAEDVLEHTVHHELAHLMMMLMNEHELNANEQFIDVLGMFLHQFNKTKR